MYYTTYTYAYMHVLRCQIINVTITGVIPKTSHNHNTQSVNNLCNNRYTNTQRHYSKT